VNLNQKRISAPRLVLPLLSLGVAGHGLVAMAQSAGTFRATGNMTTGRVQHTATLLPDGRVLIAGGQGNSSTFQITSSAETYDPASGTFAPRAI
jgi:Galactose oxidase, central domain